MTKPAISKPLRLFATIMACSITFSMFQTATAQREPSQLGEKGSKIWESDVVLYDGNGSYYQLVTDFSKDGSGATWEDARTLAAKRTYKGRKGRLAMMDSAALQQWVLSTFNLVERGYSGNTWIGIRYWCNFRKLTDINGATYSFQSFNAWDSPWYRDGGTRCDTNPKLPYMGVYIHGVASRWQAAGYLKRFPHYLVEYPAINQDTAETAKHQPGS